MSEEIKSNVLRESQRYEKQIKEIQDALESIKLDEIDDIDEKLKATNSKIVAMLKVPVLIAALDEMRTRNKLKQKDIKGSATLSPLDDGTLD